MESCEAVSPLHKRLIHGVSPNFMHGDTKPVVAAHCKVKSIIDEPSSKGRHDESRHDCAMCSGCDSTDKGRDDGRVCNAARVKRVAFNERASNFAAKDESLSGSKPGDLHAIDESQEEGNTIANRAVKQYMENETIPCIGVCGVCGVCMSIRGACVWGV